MTEPLTCDLCHQRISSNGHYIVRIDVFADPSTPPMNFDDLDTSGGADAIARTIEQIQQMSAEDIHDAVHRHFEYQLCSACHRQYLSNPLGKPRNEKIGEN